MAHGTCINRKMRISRDPLVAGHFWADRVQKSHGGRQRPSFFDRIVKKYRHTSAFFDVPLVFLFFPYEAGSLSKNIYNYYTLLFDGRISVQRLHRLMVPRFDDVSTQVPLPILPGVRLLQSRRFQRDIHSFFNLASTDASGTLDRARRKTFYAGAPLTIEKQRLILKEKIRSTESVFGGPSGGTPWIPLKPVDRASGSTRGHPYIHRSGSKADAFASTLFQLQCIGVLRRLKSLLHLRVTRIAAPVTTQVANFGDAYFHPTGVFSSIKSVLNLGMAPIAPEWALLAAKDFHARASLLKKISDPTAGAQPPVMAPARFFTQSNKSEAEQSIRVDLGDLVNAVADKILNLQAQAFSLTPHFFLHGEVVGRIKSFVYAGRTTRLLELARVNQKVVNHADRFRAAEINNSTAIAQDFGSPSRRVKGRLLKYSPLDATQNTSQKIGKMGELFISAALRSSVVRYHSRRDLDRPTKPTAGRADRLDFMFPARRGVASRLKAAATKDQLGFALPGMRVLNGGPISAASIGGSFRQEGVFSRVASFVKTGSITASSGLATWATEAFDSGDAWSKPRTGKKGEGKRHTAISARLLAPGAQPVAPGAPVVGRRRAGELSHKILNYQAGPTSPMVSSPHRANAPASAGSMIAPGSMSFLRALPTSKKVGFDSDGRVSKPQEREMGGENRLDSICGRSMPFNAPSGFEQRVGMRAGKIAGDFSSDVMPLQAPYFASVASAKLAERALRRLRPLSKAGITSPALTGSPSPLEILAKDGSTLDHEESKMGREKIPGTVPATPPPFGVGVLRLPRVPGLAGKKEGGLTDFATIGSLTDARPALTDKNAKVPMQKRFLAAEKEPFEKNEAVSKGSRGGEESADGTMHSNLLRRHRHHLAAESVAKKNRIRQTIIPEMGKLLLQSSRDFETYKEVVEEFNRSMTGKGAGGSISRSLLSAHESNFPDLLYSHANPLPGGTGKAPDTQDRQVTESLKVSPSPDRRVAKTPQFPQVNVNGLANQVYDLIVTRIRREREMRGR